MTHRSLACLVATAALALYSAAAPAESPTGFDRSAPRPNAKLVAELDLPICGRAIPPSKPKLVQRTYPVADLVIPRHGEEKTQEARLIDLIQDVIEPASWSKRGGHGTIDYFPLGMALVVCQTPGIQEQLSQLLAGLQAGLEVSVETRILCISPAMAERLARHGIPCDYVEKEGVHKPNLAMLSDLELFLLMEIVQHDRRANLMQAPKLTIFNGQAATVKVEDLQWFVTDVQFHQRGGSVIFVPRQEPVNLGLNVGVQPMVSADRRSIRLKVNATITDLVSSPVPLAPVTRFITPMCEGGTQGQPVPLTQFVQVPEFNRLQLDETVTVADGQTAVFSGWKFQRENPNALLTWLSKVPGLDQFFKPARAAEHVLVLVTPRIIMNTEEDWVSTGVDCLSPAPVVAPVCIPTPVAEESDVVRLQPKPKKKEAVAKLLARYQKACHEGNHAEARKLAQKALALDPTCFGSR